MPLHTQREEDIKAIKMIEQIIEKFKESFKDNYNGKNSVGMEYYDIPLPKLKSFLRSEFSSYNKQLLDGIEKEVKELPTESVYDHEGDYYYGTTRKKDVLLTVNKYRV